MLLGIFEKEWLIMIGFFKYLKGYLCICVTGFSPERFMNLCSNRDIILWNIHKEQDAYYMCISIEGFYKLRPIVKKTGTKVAITKRCGLPFLLSGIWKRKIFLLGFILAALFWSWSSGYIWAIDINGNFTITDDVISDYLYQNNIYVGMKKDDLNIEMLKSGIRKEFYQVTWTSAKLEGTKLTLEIKENDKLDNEKDYNGESEYDTPCDLVAQKDGIVSSMIVREGVPQVTIGQEVKKGDILVTGKIPVYNEDGTVRKYNYCSADADILLEHDVNVVEPMDLFYEKKIYTGREKKQYYINFSGENIDLIKVKNPFLSYDTISKEKQMKLLSDYYLPIKVGSYIYREYYIVEEKYTDEEAKEILNKKYKKIISTLEEKGVQIIGKDVKIETNDSKWVLRGVFKVLEDAGVSVSIEEEMLTEETPTANENME